MTQHDFLMEQLKAEKANLSYAVATIVKAEGSTPRTSGKMLIYPDGTTYGTIGGGKIEKLAGEDAVTCIIEGKNVYKEYDLVLEGEGIGMACGGSMAVLIEVFCNKPQLVMCGAGHVGAALIKMAQFCEFDVTLVDTRPDELIRDKIELADHFIHVDDFYQGLLDAEIAAGAYYVIATFGHAHDGEALQAALQKKAEYIGMIGSKSKVAVLFENILKSGFIQEQLDNVYTPIGLDIGSETPEEIALSIIAEIMMLKNGGSAHHLRDIVK